MVEARRARALATCVSIKVGHWGCLWCYWQVWLGFLGAVLLAGSRPVCTHHSTHHGASCWSSSNAVARSGQQPHCFVRSRYILRKRRRCELPVSCLRPRSRICLRRRAFRSLPMFCMSRPNQDLRAVRRQGFATGSAERLSRATDQARYLWPLIRQRQQRCASTKTAERVRSHLRRLSFSTRTVRW
jgi:hypothetical protein